MSGGKIVGIVAICLAVLLGVTLVVPMIRVALFPIFAANKAIDAAEEVTEIVADGDRIVYTYEWFHRQFEGILATARQLRNAERMRAEWLTEMPARSEWDMFDKQEGDRLRSIVLGLENHLVGEIADYNAKSKMVTRQIFKGKTLPKTIDAEFVAKTLDEEG